MLVYVVCTLESSSGTGATEHFALRGVQSQVKNIQQKITSTILTVYKTTLYIPYLLLLYM